MSKRRGRSRRKRDVSYDYRIEVLNRNGFSSYREYLKSDLWSDIKRRVLERDGGACRVCGQEAKYVHHDSYGDVTIRGEHIGKLYSLCLRCHGEVEFEGKRKRDFSSARKALAHKIEFGPHRWTRDIALAYTAAGK